MVVVDRIEYAGTIYIIIVCFLMIRRPPRSTLDRSSAASDVYKRQEYLASAGFMGCRKINCPAG